MKKISVLLKEKSFGNMIWLMSDSILRLGLGFVVSVWLARYMGPTAFGSFNYAYAMIVIYSAVASLGMNGVVVRELIKGNGNAATILGTSFFLQVIGSLFSTSLVILTVLILRPKDYDLLIVLLCMLPSVLLRSSDIIKYWFESIIASKYTVLAQNIAFFISSLIKLSIIICKGSYLLIAATVSIEALIVSILLFYFYVYKRNSLRWKVNFCEAKRLLSISWPLILSGLALMLYMRIDQIMIGNMINDSAVGIYSVAVKMVEIWYFVPIAIVSSLFPRIIKAKDEEDEVSYHSKLQFLYDILVVISVCIAIVVTFFSDFIISFCYGPHYNEASYLIKIYAWVSVFYFLSSASGRWYINEGLQKYALNRNILGLFIGVVLNYYLIPIYGAAGSVYATLIAYSCAGYFFDFLSKKTRIAFYQKSKSLWIPGALFRIKNNFQG
ncbi:flippase [Raoultella planticola]|uniref:flippase n=1 Tax=Raoultella planticola TaxID=575 RepID=UPI0039823B09